MAKPRVPHPLEEAAHRGDEAEVRSLLSSPRPPVQQALSAAVAMGHTAIARMLLPKADPWDSDLTWAMAQALSQSHWDVLEVMWEARNTRERWPSAHDVLIEPVRQGNLDLVRRLLPHVSEQKRNDSTLLQIAVTIEHPELIQQILLDNPLRLKDGQALGLAVMKGRAPLTRLLLDAHAGTQVNPDLLVTAAESGYPDLVRQLIEVIDPQYADSRALAYAIDNEHRAVVDILLPLSDLVKVVQVMPESSWAWPEVDAQLSTQDPSCGHAAIQASPPGRLPRTLARWEAELLRQSHEIQPTASSASSRHRL